MKSSKTVNYIIKLVNQLLYGNWNIQNKNKRKEKYYYNNIIIDLN